MNDDMELVRHYAADQSGQAFETLVSRYVNLVYSAAVRQVNDPQWAEEITQVVFIILARKAGGLGPGTILPSWLYRTAQYVAADAVKAERRRAHREYEAHMQTILNEAANETAPEETWTQIAPLLDRAMSKLGEKDHAALVLRFFENRDFAEVGAALGASEDAAKMRVGRAMEKLRKSFGKGGIHSTAAIIAGAISSNSVQVAPVGLVKTISSVAIAAKGATASVSTITLMKGALKVMAWTKVKMAVAAGIMILAAAGTATVAIQHVEHQRARARSLFFQPPDPKSAAGLSLAAAKFVAALCKQGQLPGFPEGKTYVPKNGNHALIEVQAPGLRYSRPGVLLSADTNVESYPVNRTLIASKSNNGHFDYHYSVTKLSETDDWRLTRAWRTDTNGNVAEEYPVQ
jgi:RNA polymerase sigma factor (sigma-70 family)